MSVYEGPIQDLIEELGRLPGVGPKSAQRLASHLLQGDIEDAERLTQGNVRLTLVIALSYGGRAEIVEAARGLRADVIGISVSSAELDQAMGWWVVAAGKSREIGLDFIPASPEKGTLAVMVSCPKADYEALQPVLAAISVSARANKLFMGSPRGNRLVEVSGGSGESGRAPACPRYRRRRRSWAARPAA